MSIPPNSELLYTQSGIHLFRGQSLVPYAEATQWMESRVSDIIGGTAPEAIWLLEHPPLYTAGTSAREHDLIQPDRFEVHKVGRGGEYTYHGPGQRVVYVMLNLNNRGRDLRRFVQQLENWIIRTLATFDVTGHIRNGRVGVWVETGQNALGQPVESKIAAIGIRIRKWVSFHGLAINVNPNLEHFDGIVPCGLSDYGVTSLSALGKSCSMAELDQALVANLPFEQYARDPD